MSFVDAIRTNINNFLGKKKDNSFGGFTPLFNTNITNLARANLKAFLGTSFHSYHTTLSIGEKNTIISRSVDMLQEAIQYVDIADQQGNTIENSLTKQILEEADAIFGGDNFTSYIYYSILHEVCCGMKTVAPVKVSKKGTSERIQVLDPRRIQIQVNKDGDETVYYGGAKLESYVKHLYKPSMNRKGYGIAKFYGAIDDAILDQATRQGGIAFYKNDATPNIVFAMSNEMTQEELNQFEKRLIKAYQGVENKGLPLASNGINQVQIIDSSPAIISGLEAREYNSNMLSMSIGLDMRGLGFMRNGGSQAELNAVMNSVNAKIKRQAERLSKDLMKDFTSLVAPLPNNRTFRFIPTYISNPQQVIDNYIKAEQRGIVSKEQVADLITNQ